MAGIPTQNTIVLFCAKDANKNVGVQVLCRHNLDILMFNELYRCCLQQLCLAISLWKTNYSFGNNLGCLGIPLLTNNLNR